MNTFRALISDKFDAFLFGTVIGIVLASGIFGAAMYVGDLVAR